MNARLVLARAVTIAIRYLSIRRQFRDRDSVDDSGPEVSVLDYSTVQIRVLPLLATTFALHYSGVAMRELYVRTRSANALDGDRAQLAELHSTSAGLKSLATELAANGIETCRRAMGGHGYGGGTGLVQINADYLSKPTVEGDNWMITQQVARFLIRKVADLTKGRSGQPESAIDQQLRAYNRRPGEGRPLENLDDLDGIVQAFERRLSWLAFEAFDARELRKCKWNDLLIDFHKLSRAYSESLLVSNFFKALSSNSVPPGTRKVMGDLFQLYALSAMDGDARGFQRCSAVTAETLDRLQAKTLQLMQRIRPHAVKLVDAFVLPDYLLDSALGRYDGRVYEDLFHRAHVRNPLNRITFNPDYRNDEIVLNSGDGGAILAKL